MSRYRSLVLFICLSAVWGTAFTAIKAGLSYFPPVLFAAIRFDVAGLVILAYAVSKTGRWRPATSEQWTVVIVSGVFMIGGYHALLFVGQQYVTSAVAAIVVGLNPILTTGFARVLLPSERLSLVGVLGLVVGLSGVVVLAEPTRTMLLDASGGGVLLAVAAVASFALGSVLTRRSTAAPAIEIQTAWSMLVGALLMHGLSAGIGEHPGMIEWTLEAILALGFLSIVASGLGFLVYFDLLAKLGPVELNLVSYVVPVFAAITGYVLLGESLTPTTVVAFGLIILGFFLVKRRALLGEFRRLRQVPLGK